MWSFGCVLYDMLAGRAPFAGDTIFDTLAAFPEHEPDQTILPADTPLSVRRLLRRCLEKDRDRRLDSASDAFPSTLQLTFRLSAPSPTAANADRLSSLPEGRDVEFLLSAAEPGRRLDAARPRLVSVKAV